MKTETERHKEIANEIMVTRCPASITHHWGITADILIIGPQYT